MLDLGEVDATRIAAVGGKGANLGELAGLPGVRVPAGFCVTTAAFRRFLSGVPDVAARLARLAALDDPAAIREHSGELRRSLEATAVPAEVQAAIVLALAGSAADATWAVRSSATAEDLPGASFAGQQDTFLNVRGEAVVEHVRRCWASLLGERAVAYRAQRGFDHGDVHMGVVVQRMVAARAAGVLFTADPLTGNREVAVIEAVHGLGEALVSGAARADRYSLRDGRILERTISGEAPALTDAQAIELARIGRRIEAHFGRPQDIEWCLDGDDPGVFNIVQSRAITALFPAPEAADGGNHVYVSVGHQQMMTDAMRPLGLSFFQATAAGRMFAAGGRLFVDVSQDLAAPERRDMILNVLGRNDPWVKEALASVVARGFIAASTAAPAAPSTGMKAATPFAFSQVGDDPSIVPALIAEAEAELDRLRREIAGKTGVELLDFIVEDLQRSRESLVAPRSMGVVMAGMDAAAWLNERMLAWLGERNAADTLSQSVDHNVTSEMGLALLDVADAVRPHPAVVEFFNRGELGDDFFRALEGLAGGPEARDAIQSFLARYGMRCAGEIDITRERWGERPTLLVPLILGNVENFGPGEAARRFARGRQEALGHAEALLDRLRALPDGEQKAAETRRMIDRLRSFIGYREYPKYGKMNAYAVYRQALLREAEQLVQAGVVGELEDLYYLRFEELREVVRTRVIDEHLVRRRRAEHEIFMRLTPPRVITSEGEVVRAPYSRADLPAGALVGLAVSAGVVEGRARVLHDMADASLTAGDILVTTFTDPSWTPLFVIIDGLVTEVGGVMTHGAVVAREYGLPAVVGVEQATRRIRDGQRIRVHGTDGYVELLD